MDWEKVGRGRSQGRGSGNTCGAGEGVVKAGRGLEGVARPGQVGRDPGPRTLAPSAAGVGAVPGLQPARATGRHGAARGHFRPGRGPGAALVRRRLDQHGGSAGAAQVRVPGARCPGQAAAAGGRGRTDGRRRLPLPGSLRTAVPSRPRVLRRPRGLEPCLQVGPSAGRAAHCGARCARTRLRARPALEGTKRGLAWPGKSGGPVKWPRGQGAARPAEPSHAAWLVSAFGRK